MAHFFSVIALVSAKPKECGSTNAKEALKNVLASRSKVKARSSCVFKLASHRSVFPPLITCPPSFLSRLAFPLFFLYLTPLPLFNNREGKKIQRNIQVVFSYFKICRHQRRCCRHQRSQGRPSEGHRHDDGI